MEQTADPSILRAIETVTRQQEELFAELDSLRSVMRPGRGAGIDPATGKESVNVLRDEAFWERRGGAEAAVRLAGLREARTRMSQIDRAVALCNQRIEQLQEQLLDWRRAAT
ncbi:hypothetical protein [Lacipirellula sp.]|uniref:hypothetical protein n=1 Tax=Lacipirellula sp. TaxID=2691419 RepID=UPI003D095ABB